MCSNKIKRSGGKSTKESLKPLRRDEVIAAIIKEDSRRLKGHRRPGGLSDVLLEADEICGNGEDFS